MEKVCALTALWLPELQILVAKVYRIAYNHRIDCPV